MKILANNGISQSGNDILTNAGFEVILINVAPSQLENYINSNNIEVLLLKNAINVTTELIDNCPDLKLIGYGGSKTDSFISAYAKSKNTPIINTPAAVANAVAELVFAHLFGMTRFLHQSNREMPLEGDMRFQELRNHFSTGTELRGKTLGIIGMGNTGNKVAEIAIGLGMNVIMHNHKPKTSNLNLNFFDGQSVSFSIESTPIQQLLKESDFISLHVPSQEKYLIGHEELLQMKKGVGIINTANGNVIDEVALINAIEEKHIKYAGLDVYEKEPNPEVQLLMNPELSLTPHIGGATIETQNRIGKELAHQIVELLA